MDRRKKLLNGIDTSYMQGAEIGALASPLVSNTDANIIYIDHADTETLRQKYRADPEVDTNSIVPVSAVWGERTIQEAIGPNMKLDYIIASHVVEHTPDLVSWLQELTSVLTANGTIRLAIPDKRFCFDYLRKETKISDVITAYYYRARRPQVNEVIDSELHHLHLNVSAAWSGNLDKDRLLEREQLVRAFSFADRANGGDYVDVHCWVFTLSSFAEMMQQLGNLGLTSLACREFYDTEINENEFIVVMTTAKQAEVVESWGRVRRESEVFCSPKSNTWPEVRLEWLERGQNSVQVAQMTEIEALRRHINALQSTMSWRMTRPFRAIMSHFRRS